MLVSTLATVLHFLATQPMQQLVQPPPVYLYAIGMALLSTVLPVFMTSAAIRRIGASRTVLIGTIGPMLTIFLAAGCLTSLCPCPRWQAPGWCWRGCC